VAIPGGVKNGVFLKNWKKHVFSGMWVFGVKMRVGGEG
jgi:hypothetical protein